MKKAFLILLVIVCVGVVVWTVYLLFTNQTEPVTGGIILAVDIGVLIWNISVLRAYRIRTGTVVAVFLIVAFIAMTVSAFAGIEPFAGIKDSVVYRIENLFEQGEDAAARKVVRATIDAFNKARGDRLADLTNTEAYKVLVGGGGWSVNHPIWPLEKIVDYKLTTLESDQNRCVILVQGGAREPLWGSVRPYNYKYIVTLSDSHWLVTRIIPGGG